MLTWPRMNYNNDKLNEIYRDTWPNLGWAKRMNEDNLPVPDDMCWVNLTQEEIKELRNKKHTLTEYGKKQLRKLMAPEEMREEAANELYQDALHELDNLAAGVDSEDFMNAYLIIQSALKVALGEEDV